MSESPEMKNDFKISWQMLKANYKAFLMTELFAILSAILMLLLVNGIIVLVFYLTPSLGLDELRNRIQQGPDIQYTIIGTIVAAIGHAFVVGFLYCQYGLSYDIMSSGDMFSEFKRAFTYFKRYWWQYMLLSFISGFILFLPVSRRLGSPPEEPLVSDLSINIVLVFIRFLVLFIFLMISSTILPSLTAQGSLKRSFIESNRMFKKAPKRIIKTWVMFFVIFFLPIMLTTSVRLLLRTYFEQEWWLFIFDGFNIAIYLLYLMIGVPLATLIATRIYNNIDIHRFKPLTKETDAESEEKLDTYV